MLNHVLPTYLIKPFNIPRSSVTDSVYDSKRSYTTPYTTVSILYTLRIRPYFAGFHVTGLRSYMSVTVYDEIRRNTVIVYGTFTLVNDRIFLVYGSLRPCFGKLRYTLTVIFLPSHLIPPGPLPSYLSLKIS
jgi:hypothetical protein